VRALFVKNKVRFARVEQHTTVFCLPRSMFFYQLLPTVTILVIIGRNVRITVPSLQLTIKLLSRIIYA